METGCVRNAFVCGGFVVCGSRVDICIHLPAYLGSFAPHHPYTVSRRLLDLARLATLKVLPGDQVGYVVVVLCVGRALLALLLLHRLVALGELAQRGQRVRAKLVEDARDELRQLLVLAVAVQGKGVCGDGGVDCMGEEVSI